jgi:hypothetical protein
MWVQPIISPSTTTGLNLPPSSHSDLQLLNMLCTCSIGATPFILNGFFEIAGAQTPAFSRLD